MNRKELIDELAAELDVPKITATRAISALFSPSDGIISRELQKGGDIRLTGFGKFHTSARDARSGRNPQTGEPMDIPARTSAKFKAGKGLTDKLN